MTMLYEIITLIILILLSGFFSGIETAFISLSRTKVRFLKEQKTRGIKYVERLKENPQRLIITILIGNNIVNISASAFATVVAINLLEIYQFPFANPVGIATGVMTLLILTFGEIIPKVYSQMHAVRVSLMTGRLVWYLQVLLFPLVISFEGLTKLTTKIAGGQHVSEKLSEEEIKSIIHFGHKEGAIERAEKEIIHNVLDFDEKRVQKVMTLKKDMIGVQDHIKAKDALKIFLSSGYNRLLVFHKRSVVGVISIWKLLKRMRKKNGEDIPVSRIMGAPVFVSQSMYLDELFAELKRSKRHLVLVVNGKKRIVGLVTDQDLVDEFFGRPYSHHEPRSK